LSLLIGAIGALTVAALLARTRRRTYPPHPAVPLVAWDAARRRVLAAAAAAAAGAVVLGLLLFARQLHELRTTVAPGAGAADVLDTRWGALWCARELLLGALAATVWWLRRGAPRAPGAAALALPAGLAVLRGLDGHAAAGPHAAVAVGVAALHVLAAGAWIGGVAALVLALSAAGRHAGALARACRAPFARAAGVGLTLVAVTGLLVAGRRVASVDALLTTDYGRTLLTKTALVAAAAGLGLANAVLLARRGRPSRLVAVEAAAGLGILMAAAVLTASSPPTGPEFAAPRGVVAPELVQRAGDLLVSATVRPNRPGANVLTVLAVSSRRPPPAPVSRVDLQLRPGRGAGGPSRTVLLTAVGGDRFAGGTDLGAGGRWVMTVRVRRGGKQVSLPFGWSVDEPDPARPVTYSARRLAPLLDLCALLLAVAAIAGGAAARRLGGAARPRRGDQRERTTSVARMPAP
jgi:copper transport protein